MKKLLFLFPLFFIGCTDNAIVQNYHKNLPIDGIKCIKLTVFPPNKYVEQSFKELYDFDNKCEIELFVEVKGGITCNSNQNIQKKATGSFPSSYLNMQLKTSKKKLYIYYKDIQGAVEKDDIEDAFSRMRKELNL